MRRGLLAALTAALAGAAAAAASAETVKIGVILTYSGPQASLGEQIDKGITLYVKEHASDLPPGVTLELVRRDDTFNADVAKRLAQELITREHVRILAGVVGTPAANAIAPLTAEAKIPFVVMNAAGVTTTRPLALYRAQLGNHAAAQLHARQLGGQERPQEDLHHGVRLRPGHRRRDLVPEGF